VNAQKLVTFAFASKRRKLAMLTMLGVAGIGFLAGGGDTTPVRKPVVTVTTVQAGATPVTAPSTPVSDKCDGVHFNVPVAAGDKRDRDGDGIACEKN
jgi:hypothetical protein